MNTSNHQPNHPTLQPISWQATHILKFPYCDMNYITELNALHLDQVTLSPNGRFLFVSYSREHDDAFIANPSWESVGYVWDLQTSTVLQEAGRASRALSCGFWPLTFSSDSRFLAEFSKLRKINKFLTYRGIYEIDKHEQTKSSKYYFKKQENSVQDWANEVDAYILAINLDCQALVTHKNGIVKIWDLTTGNLKLTLDTGSYVDVIAISADGQSLVTSRERTIQLWNLKTGELKKILNMENSVKFLVISPDSQTLASNTSTSIQLWNVRTGELKTTLNPEEYLDSLAISPDGRLLVSTASNLIQLWDLNTGELKTNLNTFYKVASVAINNNKLILVRGRKLEEKIDNNINYINSSSLVIEEDFCLSFPFSIEVLQLVTPLELTSQSEEPREYDVVLGGQNLPPADTAVLGGMEKLKQDLTAVKLQDRIAAIKKAKKYSNPGIELANQAIKNESEKLRLAILSESSTTPLTGEEITRSPQHNRRWVNSTDTDLDEKILGVKIIAYQIQWFNGRWSQWYVPGVNDLYQKVDYDEPVRRVWAHFNDHTHRYIYIPLQYRDNIRSFNEFNLNQIPERAGASGVKLLQSEPTEEMRWLESLFLNLDQELTGHKMVAYRLQWFDSTWSSWFIPGYQDVYWSDSGETYRMWAYFSLFNYQYLYFAG